MVSRPEITLMGFFGMGPMQNVIRKRLFGGPYLRFADYITVSGYLYECGALLGRAKRDELMIVAKMIAQSGREGEAIEWWQDSARKRLSEYVDTYGEQPKSLQIFLMETEYKKAGVVLPYRGPELHTDREFKRYMRLMTKIANAKMPVEDMEPLIKFLGMEGIGFGSNFPELTEKMYREANENINLESWAKAREYGVILPEQPTIISLEEQEQTVLSMVAIYVYEYFPELVEPLGLTEILRQAQISPEESDQV